MPQMKTMFLTLILGVISLFNPFLMEAQDLPLRYATLELFTNTPCPVCGSQNPGLFNRLTNYDGEYHLISFYPGKPYSSCVFYQTNITENTTRFQHYSGEIFGSPTVALNGIDFKSSSGVTNTVLNNLTGGTSWLHVDVEETTGVTRTVSIQLDDVVGGSLTTGRLFAVIVEKEVFYNAPNGETVHHNVFRKFLTAAQGEDVDMSAGSATRMYSYALDGSWNTDEIYVIAWLSDPVTEEIYNSGSRFDPDFTSSIEPAIAQLPLKLYPNPSSTEVFVVMPTDVTSAEFQVYDQQGRLLQSIQNHVGSEVKIPTTGFLAGKYMVRVVTGKSIYSGQFVIVR
jgi:hypothetical protein